MSGPWIVDDLGDGWTFAINGGQKPVEYLGSQLPPLTTYVHKNGMPIAVIGLSGGAFTGSIDGLLNLMEVAK
jgi:hypothetical protein